MILYHGTNIDFDVIEFKKTRKYKDFGQGFYLTDLKSQAEELAAKRALMFGGTPIVQKYQFDERLLASSDMIQYSYVGFLIMEQNRPYHQAAG